MLAKRKIKYATEPRTISYDHASATSDGTTKLWKVPAGRSYRISRVYYNNPTGLAANASDYYTIKVLNGATVAALWSTQTGANGTLSADTPVELVIQADAAPVLPENTNLALFLDLTGTATLPAGRVVIEGDLI